jgi:glycogen debranching enzyme
VTDADDHRQPRLHDLTAIVLAPVVALSAEDGQIRRHGAQGVFHADRRVLSRAVLRIDGREPEPATGVLEGAGGARFVGLAPRLGDPGPDPTVRLDRVRRATADGVVEAIEVTSRATGRVRATVTLDLSCDLAPIEAVRAGATAADRSPERTAPGRLVWRGDGTEVTVAAERGDGTEVTAGAERDDDTEATAGGGEARAELEPVPRLVWTLDLPPGGRTVLRWRLRVSDPRAAVAAPIGPVEWSPAELTADDRRLVRLLDRSLADLRSLRLADPDAPDDTFLAAGVPWYLTLFGRDSLWAAHMLLPLGTRLARGTLNTLARRQGRRVDPRTGEAPGKIIHEVRRADVALDGPRLPPAYYGTVDATPLWISLLHDAWRWGLPERDVVALLPHLGAALGWLSDHGDPDGDGFIEYVDHSGRGLANQGWKDSGDAVRFRDGSWARPPIALAEVQGYAYRAALDGAALLDAFGLSGGGRWRAYAADLAELFRARFWVDGPAGPYPALALDRDKRPVDALTSNIGHLLGTGLLSAKEQALVADRLASAAMAAGYGLRTMSALDGGFNPLSYHCGSIWPHDTAIVLAGLARAGFGDAAAGLVDGLLAAGEAFGYRVPELYGGDDRTAVARPVPYPSACRPQAWSAAAAVTVLQAAVGLEPDVPAGRVRVRPLPGAPLGALAVRGLRVAGHAVDVAVDRAGAVTIAGLPPSLALVRDPVDSLVRLGEVPHQRHPRPSVEERP